MTYLEAVKLVRDIEERYDVMSIRYKGVSVWPFLRLFLLDRISVQTEIKASGSIVKVVLKSLFAYNPLKVFKRHDVWLFTGCERRKRIGDKMIHRISGGISSNVPSCLMIEKPDLLLGHYRKQVIEEKEIVSESWMLILFHFFERCLRLIKPKIEKEEVMVRLLEENNVSFDYQHYVRMLNAKRMAMRIALGLLRKPKLVLMECPYDSMGYMWACHQLGVKFLELQHGVAGAKHNAYNALFYEPQMQPDGICVFGNEEYRYFTEEEPQYTKNVYLTGLYMLEKADKFFTKDLFINDREKYERIVIASGQKGYEKELSDLIDTVAGKHPELLFIYIPRMADEELHFESGNVQIVRDANIYEYLKWADVHITISSTTCLEAQYFETPTIFFDFENRASSYYGALLLKENGAVYINNPDEFDDAYKEMTEGVFTYKEVFVHNHVERIVNVIKEQLGKNLK